MHPVISRPLSLVSTSSLKSGSELAPSPGDGTGLLFDSDVTSLDDGRIGIDSVERTQRERRTDKVIIDMGLVIFEVWSIGNIMIGKNLKML